MVEYYPISKKWTKIRPHLSNPKVQFVLVRDFNKYTIGMWNTPFKKGMKPHDFESCDWWCDKRGHKPEYWDYVKHAACHWLVNFNLELAKLVEPEKKWRVRTAQTHSTVWDGENTLFDFNFLAMGIPADEAFELSGERILKVGKRHYVGYPVNPY